MLFAVLIPLGLNLKKDEVLRTKISSCTIRLSNNNTKRSWTFKALRIGSPFQLYIESVKSFDVSLIRITPLKKEEVLTIKSVLDGKIIYGSIKSCSKINLDLRV